MYIKIDEVVICLNKQVCVVRNLALASGLVVGSLPAVCECVGVPQECGCSRTRPPRAHTPLS